jgi:hypothetical protein
MKIPLIVFGIFTALIALLLFGSLGISLLFQKMGWSHDLLAGMALVFIVLAGLCLTAWRLGAMP